MNGHLTLNFKRRGHRTVIAYDRSTVPLRASKSIQLTDSDALCVMLLNPTGGLLGGDRLTTDIDLGERAHVVLTTPSASKVYRTRSGPAIHQTTVRLAKDSVLEYVPDHVIPHPGSAFRQSLTVNMEQGSRAIILDGFSVGRIARGEKWLFKEFSTNLEVNSSGRLLCRDRIRIQPDSWAPSGLGSLGSANYAATLLLCSDADIDWRGTANEFTGWFSDGGDAIGGASALANGGCLVRFYTESAHCLKQTVSSLWGMARLAILGEPPMDLRKGPF